MFFMKSKQITLNGIKQKRLKSNEIKEMKVKFNTYIELNGKKREGVSRVSDGSTIIWGIKMKLLVIEATPKKEQVKEGLVIYEFLNMTHPDLVCLEEFEGSNQLLNFLSSE